VEGRLRWGLIPHFCERRSDFAPIHARAETVAENEWFGDAYRKRRCVVPMNSFLRKDGAGKSPATAGHVRRAGVGRRFRCVLPFGAAPPITVENSRQPGAPSGFRGHRPEGDRVALRLDGRDAVFPDLPRRPRHHVDRTRPGLERKTLPLSAGGPTKPKLARRAPRQAQHPVEVAACLGATRCRHRRRTRCKGPDPFGCLGRRKLRPSR
jgi:hypothetical protein